MLHRSASSRRRRQSRSGGSSPGAPAPARTRAISPGGRRASIAVSPVEPQSLHIVQRSPRHSLVPDISLQRDSDSESLDLAVPTHRSSRNSLIPDAMSPRNSLVPDSFNRSPRNSLVPDNFNRSPRNSLIPENFNKSPRNSLVPDSNRSPRHSLVPGDVTYSSRNNLSADFNRSPRNSLIPDSNRSPRHSLIPSDTLSPDPTNRSSRHSLIPSDSQIWNNRTSPNGDEPNGTRSPRHTSPRGSIAPGVDTRTSPRDSISEYPGDRSPRGSIAGDGHNKSPRGSLGPENRLSRIDQGRSPRGSLSLTFQEPISSDRRYSADNQTGKPLSNRSVSPYRMSLRGPQVNLGYTGSTWSDAGSRRASSSVSQLPQVSGDEQRRLCSEHTKLGPMGSSSALETGIPLGISLATYGSVAYQLKDANLEASGTCDFVCRALRIVNKTVAVTVVLVCLSTLPLLMLIMGVQFLRDCPQEPNIPVYMVVGGGLGCIKMAWVLWGQLGYRRLAPGGESSTSAGSRVASLALTVFLVAWFALGNYWILRIKWPEYFGTLHEPNKWCHRTLYVFAVIHLYIVYTVFSFIGVLVVMLAGCQLVGCPWLGPGRYK